jgi:4-hydroxy-3-methylbut-2-enyl diphosphate reductase
LEVFIASQAGFCFGVTRALELALAASETPIYTLGPLVHNPLVINKLKERGIHPVSTVEEIREGSLLIRTHGVPPSVIREAEKKNLRIIDATCPLVKKIHGIVSNLKNEGYRVAVIGHSHHPEVQGILGYSGDDSLVVQTEDEAAVLSPQKKLGVVVQTTELTENFHKIALRLLPRAEECRIFNTICFATQERQRAALELAKEVDLMVIVGGKNSSNTRKLLEISQEAGTDTYLVESAEELDPGWFSGKSKIGLTGGASTPDEAIQRVKRTVESFGNTGLPGHSGRK